MYEHRSFKSAPQFCFVVRCPIKANNLQASSTGSIHSDSQFNMSGSKRKWILNHWQKYIFKNRGYFFLWSSVLKKLSFSSLH